MAGRFVRLPHEWLDQNLRLFTPAEFAVWTVLKRHEDPRTHRCFPGEDLIAEKVGVCRDTVFRALQGLVAKKCISMSWGRTSKGRRREYRVLI